MEPRDTHTLNDLPSYDLGVLLVHGVGTQTRGSTLTDFGTPLIDWLVGRAKNQGGAVKVQAASLVRDDEPARAEIAISTEPATRWLFAESWWAESFPGARFSDVAHWGLLIVPWAIGSHFAKRLSSVESGKRGHIRWAASFASALITLLGGLLLSPLLLLILAITMLLGKIPIPQLQTALSQLQSPIASSLGDSYMLVTRPIEAAAIQAKIAADLRWLNQRCRKVAIVAHSQGAALAARVVSDTPDYEGLLITFGSGLRKLEELEAIRDESWMARGAWFTVVGIVGAALAIAALPAVIVQSFEGKASAMSVAVIVGFGATAILVATLGLRDLLRRTDPASLNAILEKLKGPRIRWTDIYAAADPVPNGALRADGTLPPDPIEVTNFGSIWRDHTAYWRNRDEFVRQVGERLIAFDSDTETRSDAADLIAERRRNRIGVLRTIGWVTIISSVAILVRHRTAWIEVAAWTSWRILGWFAGLIGWTISPAVVPALDTWQQSVGWLLLVLSVNWVARLAWNRWNESAMKDIHRHSQTSHPTALTIPFWLQAWLAIYLIDPSFGSTGWGFGLALAAATVAIVMATSRGTVARTLESAAVTAAKSEQAVNTFSRERAVETSSPEQAVNTIWNLATVVVGAGAIVWFYFIVVPEYLAEHPWARWAMGILVVVLVIAVIHERRKRRERKL